VVEQINSLEPSIEKLSDQQLKEKANEFKKRLAGKETLDDILPEAFACVREAAKRSLGQRHYDVQLIGGIALHQGKIAEMKTGEGKTLASTLPIYLNALEGRGVHLITVNDYLSRRDSVWMGQVYNALGVSVACINHDSAYLYDESFVEKSEEKDEVRDALGAFKVVHEYLRPVDRKEAYRADITYGTNNEFGFDYLRDNLIYDASQLAQRSGREGGWNYVIVDEIDSILIDEARTPLIISRPDEESGELYDKFARLVPRLVKEQDYEVDEKLRAVTLTQDGISKVEKILGMDNLYQDASIKFIHHLDQALKAEVLFAKDQEYVVKEGEVIIVDAFTGRLMPGRRYSDGLHQAIEAKEKVTVQKESRTVATITFQNYFRMYKKLSGMTGTAFTSAEEFFKVYGLEVIQVPTNDTLIRNDKRDKVYRSEIGKFKAVAREIKRLHEKGQPILLGTVSIEKNEYISSILKQLGIPHKLLNAKNHEQEAQIIAQAGRMGAVTVATNMAGRGVDIVLGGNPSTKQEGDAVRELGGLHVIGTERHEARRIDDQLRGRAGRQGDRGDSQFFVSLEDDLMRIFGGDKIKQVMARLNIPEDEPIESKMVSKAIESAQSRIEGHHFDSRKHVLEYDEVINKHRGTIYKMRRDIILAESPTKTHQDVQDMILAEVEKRAGAHTSEAGEVEIEELAKSFQGLVGLNQEEFASLKRSIKKLAEPEKIKEKLVGQAMQIYKEKEERIGSPTVRALERTVMLRVIDELWLDHLEQMDYIKSSVGLRAYGQRDPLVEYKTESHRLFQELLDSLQTQVSLLVFRMEVAKVSPSQNLQFSGPAKTSGQVKTKLATSGPGKKTAKIGRNEVVKITNGSETKELKYKKAEPLLEGGQWKLV